MTIEFTKWIKFKITEGQYSDLKNASHSAEKTIENTVRRALIDAGYIRDHLDRTAMQPLKTTENTNKTINSINKTPLTPFGERQEKMAMKKKEAEECGWTWDEKRGCALDMDGNPIEQDDEGDWVAVERSEI